MSEEDYSESAAEELAFAGTYGKDPNNRLKAGTGPNKKAKMQSARL